MTSFNKQQSTAKCQVKGESMLKKGHKMRYYAHHLTKKYCFNHNHSAKRFAHQKKASHPHLCCTDEQFNYDRLTNYCLQQTTKSGLSNDTVSHCLLPNTCWDIQAGSQQPSMDTPKRETNTKQGLSPSLQHNPGCVPNFWVTVTLSRLYILGQLCLH